MNNQQKLDEIYQYIKDIRDNIVQINNTIQDNPNLKSVIDRVVSNSTISKEGYAKLLVLNAYLHMKKHFEELPQELDKRIVRLERVIKDNS